ncbi:MAG: transposase [Desulfobulbus oligotrophicus]|jgi:transposase|nr:transposase [Desulfobulbus oligotrophicus]
MSGKRRVFTKEFKVDAVKLVTEQGYTVSVAARNLGIYTSVLRRWRDQMETDGEKAFPGKGFMTPEKEELHRLRKEVKRLEMERDILKKTTAFFANLSKSGSTLSGSTRRPTPSPCCVR